MSSPTTTETSNIKKHHTQTTEGEIAERHASVLLAKDPIELEKAYDKWAIKYDEDLSEISGLPLFGLTAVQVMKDKSFITPKEYPKLLDFGCGTGPAGPAFHDLGWNGAGGETVLHGCDLSQGMLSVAATRCGDSDDKCCYSKLIKSTYESSGGQYGYYDIVHASGIFAPSQAPPKTFDEFIQLLRRNGLAIFTIRTGYYDGPEGSEHKMHLEGLCYQRKWEIISQTKEEYLPKEGLMCYVFCMKRL